MARSWGLFFATYGLTAGVAYLISRTQIPMALSYAALSCDAYPGRYPLDGLAVLITAVALATAWTLRRRWPQPLLSFRFGAGLHFKLGAFGMLAIFIVYHAVKTALETCGGLEEATSPRTINAEIVVGSLFAAIAAHLLFDLRRYRFEVQP
jgi:hypothetical protein